MNTLQDRFWLIIAGLIAAAAAAAAFWRFTGEWGGLILLSGTVINLSVDNNRLRKQIAQLKLDDAGQ